LLQAEQKKLGEIESELMARRAIKSPYYWLTQCTKTRDEQDQLNPYKPFPERPYLRPLLDALEHEPVLFLEKSRTMMASWTVAGWAAHKMFTRPATGVIFQSEDHRRAINDVECVKILWEQSIGALKERWKIDRGKQNPWHQAAESFHLDNNSWCLAIPGNPDRIRSEHPTIVVLDEAAHILCGEESYNVAVATRTLHVVALSSANPGWFRTATKAATPVDWPKYAK
jgi:hypothetical protein